MQGPRTSARRRAAPALLIAALIVLFTVAGCGGEDGSEEPDAPDAARIATARVYQHGAWTVPNETPASVGRALARLEPTWVSSLVRFTASESPTAEEVKAWETIRKAVRAASPDAQFDIELNALEFRTPDEIREMMSAVRSKFDNDGWMFDFYTPAYRERPEVVEAAVEDAHDNGEWIGGNAFGLDKNPPVPPGSDFIAVQDFGFKIDLAAVRKLAEQVPVAFHLGNSPGQAKSDGCVFIDSYTTAERTAYVSKRAKQQAGNNFRFGYPVFFPECAGEQGTPQAGIFTFNAPRDGSLMDTIERLAHEHD